MRPCACSHNKQLQKEPTSGSLTCVCVCLRASACLVNCLLSCLLQQGPQQQRQFKLWGVQRGNLIVSPH
jgi:hypothetical protein